MTGTGPITDAERGGMPADVYLLGQVDFETCLALQHRLVYEAGGRREARLTLVACEHPPAITVGRQGSWGHIKLGRRELESRQVSLHWVSRGGGCWLHGPGQLALYPIVPLAALGWTVGDYLRRLEAGVVAGLSELGLECQTRPDHSGVWGRSGQIAAFGVSVKNWVACHGAFINVSPAMHLYRYVSADPRQNSVMSSLAAERRQPLKMPRVREAVVRQVCESLGCGRYQLHSGLPVWARRQEPRHEPAARAG